MDLKVLKGGGLQLNLPDWPERNDPNFFGPAFQKQGWEEYAVFSVAKFNFPLNKILC
jgi:hypothetical protein